VSTKWMRASWPVYCARECCARSITENRTADAARVGAQSSHRQPRPEPSDELDQSSVSRLGHCLCRYPSVCSALSGTVATEDRACRRAPAGRFRTCYEQGSRDTERTCGGVKIFLCQLPLKSRPEVPVGLTTCLEAHPLM
jgi:hypothetical protein